MPLHFANENNHPKYIEYCFMKYNLYRYLVVIEYLLLKCTCITIIPYMYLPSSMIAVVIFFPVMPMAQAASTFKSSPIIPPDWPTFFYKS